MAPRTELDTDGPAISATRIRMFRECNRRYWWEYGPLKIKQPQTPAQAFGTEVHAVIENYFLHGTEPPVTQAGLVATPGLSCWGPRESYEVEKPFVLELDGYKLPGTIDLYRPASDGVNPLVGDHKTTKSKKYIPTENRLKTDEQVLLYGMAALTLQPEVQLVDFKWVYYVKEKPYYAVPVTFTMSRDEIKQGWSLVLPNIARIFDIYREQDYKKIKTNEQHCMAYGGCPFLGKCFGGKNMGAFDGYDGLKNRVTTVVDSLKTTPDKAPDKAPDKSPDKSPDKPKARARGINPPVKAQAVLEHPATPPVAVPDAQAEETTTPTQKTATVFYDCIPLAAGVQPALLSQLAAPAMAKVCAAYSVEHWQLVPFGAGPPALEVYFRRQLAEYPLTGYVYASSFSAEGKALFGVLSEHASLLIKGI